MYGCMDTASKQSHSKASYSCSSRCQHSSTHKQLFENRRMLPSDEAAAQSNENDNLPLDEIFPNGERLVVVCGGPAPLASWCWDIWQQTSRTTRKLRRDQGVHLAKGVQGVQLSS